MPNVKIADAVHKKSLFCLTDNAEGSGFGGVSDLAPFSTAKIKRLLPVENVPLGHERQR